MQEFFYHGMTRLDFGFGNPNKTAIMIAQLIIFCLFLLSLLPRREKLLRWVSMSGAFVLLLLLMQTFSRGGAVALALGLVPIVVVYRKKITRKILLILGGVATVLCFHAVYIGFIERLLKGFFLSDASVENRFRIWSEAPKMIASASNGWGWGNSGLAYMRWYQDLGSAEKYRTLINSHLTWMVEGDWLFRFLYVIAWCVVFCLCYPGKESPRKAFAFSLWLVLAVGMCFSSVGELAFLWVLPIISLFCVLFLPDNRIRVRQFFNRTILVFVVMLLCFGILYFLCETHSQIKYDGKKTIVGSGKVAAWVVVDEECFGVYDYAKNIRRYCFSGKQDCSVVLFDSLEKIPVCYAAPMVVVPNMQEEDYGIVSRLVGCAKHVVLVCPKFDFDINENERLLSPNVTVVYGANSQSDTIFSWEEYFSIKRIWGCADFFPDLTCLLGNN